MKRQAAWIYLTLPAIGLLIAVYIPALVQLVVLSFEKHIQGQYPEPSFTPENYFRFVSDPFHTGVLLRTLYVSFSVTLLSILISYPLAYAVVRAIRLRKIILPILVLSFFVSGVSRILGWFHILGFAGPINNLLILLGVISSPMEILFTETAVIISMADWSLPIVTLTLVASINSVDVSLEQAAQNLGASLFETFRGITLPLTLPGIAAAGILCFALSVTAFVDPMLLGGGRVLLLASHVYSSMIYSLNYPFASAGAMIMIMIIFTLTYLASKVLKTKAQL